MRWLLVLVPFFLASCEGGDDLLVDAGPADSGRGPDGCPIGAQRDASISITCDPATGGGCAGDRACVWQLETDEGACRCTTDTTAGRSERCNGDFPECGPGLACLQFDAFAESTCFQVCTLPEGAECAPLDTAEAVFLCFAVDRGELGPTEGFGVCAPLGRPCDILQNDCPTGETCALITPQVTACAPAGNIPVGGDCTVGDCVRGTTCASLVDQNDQPLGTRCYEPCDLGAASCSAGTCTDVGADGFGLCL